MGIVVDSVTLSAAMRANLLSLQGTSGLMATTQGRLATGKKVNSALDNPTSYFAAQSLTNRASDLSNLLDGMGQGIQTITAATQGISSAESIITQMQAVANSAQQSAGSSTGSITPSGVPDGGAAVAADDGKVTYTNGYAIGIDGAVGADSTHLLTAMTDNLGGSLGVTVGDTFTYTQASGPTATFTVTATSTMKDLQTFLSSAAMTAPTAMLSAVNAGMLEVQVTGGASPANDVVFSGTLAAKVGLNGSTSSGNGASLAYSGQSIFFTGSASGTVPMYDEAHSLWSLTDSQGKSLGIQLGDTLTYQIGNGTADTFTVGASVSTAAGNGGGCTMYDLNSWLSNEAAAAAINNGTSTVGTASTVSSGKLVVADGSTTEPLTIGGNLAKALGLPTVLTNNVAAVTTATGSVKAYVTTYKNVPTATGNTPLALLTTSNGQMIQGGNGGNNQPGCQITFTLNTGLGIGGTNTITLTEGMTVNDLINQIGTVPGLSAAIDSAGNLNISNSNIDSYDISGGAWGVIGAIAPGAIGGNGGTLNMTLYAGSTSGGGGSPSGIYTSQFDTLREQLDQLVADSSYQGVNLIGGTTNAPLTVTFNNNASNPNQLVVNAIDLTSTGLGLTAATGSGSNAGWSTKAAVNSTLALLTAANTTLRNASSTLGTNLTTVQTRQTFTTNLINTLQNGSGLLTNADMNQESANMLALQTQQQLGTSSLSLASQAAQSVLKLFP